MSSQPGGLRKDRVVFILGASFGYRNYLPKDALSTRHNVKAYTLSLPPSRNLLLPSSALLFVSHTSTQDGSLWT